MFISIACGVIDSVEERKESTNVFEHSNMPKMEKDLKCLIKSSKHAMPKKDLCPKTIRCGTMSNISVKCVVKTSFNWSVTIKIDS